MFLFDFFKANLKKRVFKRSLFDSSTPCSSGARHPMRPRDARGAAAPRSSGDAGAPWPQRRHRAPWTKENMLTMIITN